MDGGTKANAAEVKVKKERPDEARSTSGDVDPEASKENMKLPNAVEWLPALIGSKSFFETCRSCSQEGKENGEIPCDFGTLSIADY